MRNMLRTDREKSKEFALAVVDKCDNFSMATVNPDGTPYCIPIYLARENDWLFFHSAPLGQKIENLRYQNRVCISCVGNVEVIPKDFGIKYESAVINGTASEVTDTDEKIKALAAISRRYTPDDMPYFDEAVKHGLNKAAVWKIHIDEISGKGREE
jgi:nitroimidazol reductase NimA-like FMN-containing flavoprotein (pyridoxamine 5'-phosphate oxidase superfamily)